jgi:hypothetical protein
MSVPTMRYSSLSGAAASHGEVQTVAQVSPPVRFSSVTCASGDSMWTVTVPGAAAAGFGSSGFVSAGFVSAGFSAGAVVVVVVVVVVAAPEGAAVVVPA